ncbi:MAG: DNA polymerase III subunit delta [Lachnospiraceae bacterium]|nr:DNA polymerase III subunit delta [Lachnospiraceae bacterium]
MNSIDEDIKTGEFARIYLLTGEEGYLRLQYRNKLKKALCRPEDTLNVATFTGKELPTEEIIDFANTMPFMADRRVVFIEDSGAFEGDSDGLSAFMGEVPSECCLIFNQEKVDKRKALYKAIQKHGRIVQFTKPSDEVLERWIAGRVTEAGLKLRRSALTLFLLQVHSDMQTMSNELDKLIAYCLSQGEITEADVRTICTVQTEDRIFEMIEDIVLKKRKEALDAYYDLLSLKEPPMKILSLIGGQFARLLTVRGLKQEGFSQDEIAKREKLHPYAVKKSLQSASRYREEELLHILEKCAAYDEAVKRGRLHEVMSVELLIFELTG